jgi:thymidylate synthase ThyX
MSMARVLADSVSEDGHRLTTLEVRMHRFTLSEFNTHRMFSRNSASSRAIPLRKQLARVVSDPALPVVWASEKPGMQGGGEIEDTETAEKIWLEARTAAAMYAEQLGELGVHKSLCNRLIEPFMWHTVIVSSTEWENFWTQRCSPLAQPEIRVAAEAMRTAYDASVPKPVPFGGWHLPLVDESEDLPLEVAKRCSVARVCRVSRENHDTGKVDVDKDLETYERLCSPGDGPPHASPLEHVATPFTAPVMGNFRGWQQLRHLVLGF